ncbi:membrane protein FAM174-like [Acropora muricata]|uniref:membrane protein FAM174-like n=1 Tax=Acropora muricata TaxID=159855 RepID=UPI0034E409B6
MDSRVIKLMIVFYASLSFSQGGASNITSNETTGAPTTSKMNTTAATTTTIISSTSNSSKSSNEASPEVMRPIKFSDNSGLLQRSLYVAVGVSVIVAIYFIVRSIKSKGRRKAKKYGVIGVLGSRNCNPSKKEKKKKMRT